MTTMTSAVRTCACLVSAVLALSSARLIAAPSAASSEEPGSEEIALFDGTSLSGWTDENGKPITNGWEVEEGVLVRTQRSGAIYTDNPFEDFELEFEWKLAKGGNSGIKYRVRHYQKGVWGQPGWLGCEYQLYDDNKSPSPVSSTGALYALYAPNDKKKLNPPGTYNHSRVVVEGNRIEHWLNGVKIVEADTSSAAWRKRIAKSKFARVKGFAQNRKGRLQIQDHGSKVWFRKIVLRPIDPIRHARHTTTGK
jgi:3-keto-disaccharide hydrolase